MEKELNSLRETDRWLRKVAVYVPILSFIVGWGCGVITAAVIYKDHERRLCLLEIQQDRDVDRISLLEARQKSIITIVKQHTGIDIQ